MGNIIRKRTTMTRFFVLFLGKSHRSIISAPHGKNRAKFCRFIVYRRGYYRREKAGYGVPLFSGKDLLFKAPVIRLVLESILSEMIDYL